MRRQERIVFHADTSFAGVGLEDLAIFTCFVERSCEGIGYILRATAPGRFPSYEVLDCYFFPLLACAEHFRQIGPMWHRVEGVAAALSREDAIDAAAPRRGPNGLKLDKETTPGIVRWIRVVSDAASRTL